MSNNTLFQLFGYDITLTHVLLFCLLLVALVITWDKLTFRKKLFTHIDAGFASIERSLEDFEPHLNIDYEDIKYLGERAKEKKEQADKAVRDRLEREARQAEAKAAGLRNDLKGLDIQASWRNPRGQ